MWYYLENGAQRGPVDRAAFNQLVGSGIILPTTFVWREGQADWLPWQSVSPAAVSAPALVNCSVCGKPFPTDQVIDLAGQTVCAACKPLAVQSLREGVGTTSLGGSVWVDRKFVVTHDQVVLPPRCFKCNEPATGTPLRRKLYWNHPALLLLILVGILIRIGILLYIIVAIITRKRAKVDIQLCDRHRAVRRNFILLGWIGAFASMALFALGASVHQPIIYGIGVVTFFGCVIVGLRMAGTSRAKRIRKKTVWMTGAGKEFLASLPQWPGEKA